MLGGCVDAVMTTLDLLLWRACDRLASLPVFPALVIAAVLGAALVVGLIERPM